MPPVFLYNFFNIFLHFRQIHSCRTQNEEYNLKKIKVNAQVTCMTTILELLGNLTRAILILIFKANTLLTYIPSIICYSILLPHAFIMNTSHNKNRVIECGWKNVLRNVVGMTRRPPENNENEAMNGIRNTIRPIKDNEAKTQSKCSKVYTISKSVTTSEINSKGACGTSETKTIKGHSNLVQSVNIQTTPKWATKEKPRSSKAKEIKNESQKYQRKTLVPHAVKKTEIFFIDLEKESDTVFNYNRSHQSSYKK